MCCCYTFTKYLHHMIYFCSIGNSHFIKSSTPQGDTRRNAIAATLMTIEEKTGYHKLHSSYQVTLLLGAKAFSPKC